MDTNTASDGGMCAMYGKLPFENGTFDLHYLLLNLLFVFVKLFQILFYQHAQSTNRKQIYLKYISLNEVVNKEQIFILH